MYERRFYMTSTFIFSVLFLSISLSVGIFTAKSNIGDMIETCRLKDKIKKLMDKRSVNVVVFYSDCKRTTLHVHRFVMSNLENNAKLKRSFVLEDDFNFLKFTITKKPVRNTTIYIYTRS